MKINNRIELQNIAINHSAHIDYKDFIKIYRECTKEPYNFLLIDTTLPSTNPLRFRKNVTVTDQIKILDRKIKQNELQCVLDKEAAKISALSSNNLDKYELLTGEDLGLKPSTVEQAKFEYSPLGKIFNKGLSEDDKKEGLFKRLENIKDKNEELINTIAINNSSKNKISTKSKVLMYNTNYNFTNLKNISVIKNLPLYSMFRLMKYHHKKIVELIKLSPRTRVNKSKRLEGLIYVRNIYKELYDIYKSKYNKDIDSLSVKN